MKRLTLSPNLALIAISLFLLNSFTVLAQVGIGNTNPNADSLLEVGDGTDTQGVLLPRVALTNTTSPAPLSTDVAGMIVYNTATAGDVTPGIYYNDGAIWVRVNPVASDDWKTTGNAGTTAGTNFLGTTDNVHLEIFTNNSSRMRVEDDGQVTIGFGAVAANANQQVNVASTYTDGVAIGGYSGGAGAGIYGQNISTGQGVQGLNNSTGIGVYGVNTSIGQGVRGYNSGNGWGVGGRAMASDGVGIVGYNTNTTGPGIIGSGANAALNYLPSTGGTFNGTFGGAGFSTSSTGTGIAGVGNGGGTTYTITGGAGVSGTGTETGVYGIAIATSGSRRGGYFKLNKSGAVDEIPVATDDPIAILAGYNGTDYFGGYFDGNQDNNSGGGGGNAGEDYAYVGIRTGGTTYKILGTGSNSTMINDQSGQKRILFSPEAPEILFEDYGTGRLSNGVAHVSIDPILASAIHVSEDYPLKVFIQLEGDCNGVFVTNKSKDGFTVKELNNGQSNVKFSWHIVANRANTIANDGRLVSKHVGVRFPIGPKKILPEPNEKHQLKEIKDEMIRIDSKNENPQIDLLKSDQ